MFDELEVVNDFQERGGRFSRLTAANPENRAGEQDSVCGECRLLALSDPIANKRGTIVRER